MKKNVHIVLYLCGVAALWIALAVRFSVPGLIACLIATAIDAVLCVLDVRAAKAERDRLAQIQLYWDSIADRRPDPEPKNADEWLECFGKKAAENAENVQKAQKNTDDFLIRWSGAAFATAGEADETVKTVVEQMPVPGRLLQEELSTLRCRMEQLMRFFDFELEPGMRRIQPVELSRVMSDAILHQSDRLRANRIGMRRSMTRLRTESDPVLLTAVLDELLDNAIRHTPENGAIGLTCREADGMAEITVEDAGSGIPESELMHIFERGFVGRNEEIGHAGLGLYFVRTYCELLGHTVSVTSAEGHGTRVVLRMKRIAEPAEK